MPSVQVEPTSKTVPELGKSKTVEFVPEACRVVDPRNLRLEAVALFTILTVQDVPEGKRASVVEAGRLLGLQELESFHGAWGDPFPVKVLSDAC